MKSKFIILILFIHSIIEARPLWNLDKGNLYKYSYLQEILNHKDAPAGGASILVEGYGDDGKLTLIFEPPKGFEAHMTEQMKKALRNEFPIVPDGKVISGRYSAGGNIQFLLDMIFPLPNKELEMGTIHKQKMYVFATGMGPLEDEVEYTLLSKRTENGDTIITYKTKGFLEPKESDKEMFKGYIELNGKSVFNITKGCFRHVVTEAEMGFKENDSKDVKMKTIITISQLDTETQK